MPELHEIMNIFADSEDSEGSHPQMPPVSSVLDPLWLDLGRYHFWEDDHFIKGFDFKNVDRWWRYYDGGGTTASASYYYYGGWDYAGYKMQDQLWTGDDSAEAKFLKGLVDLAQVAALAHGSEASTSYNQTTIWDISTRVASLDDFLQDYVGGEDAGLIKAYQGIDVPDGAMRGSAAAAFAARIYDLAKRLGDLNVQLDRFHNGVNDLRSAIIPKAGALLGAVQTAVQSPNGTIKGTIDNWYFGTAAGSEEFHSEREQFTILYHTDPPVRGIVGDSVTDSNINNELKMRWKEAYKPVFEAANDLYNTMSSHYETIATRLLPIRDPVGGLPPGYNDPGGSGGDGDQNSDSDDDGVPDWLEDLYGDGEDGPGGDPNDVPDWLKDLYDNEGGSGGEGPPPPLDENFPGGDGLDNPFGDDLNDLFGGPGGNGDGSTIGPPLNANFPGGDGLDNPFGSGGGSTIGPPLNANFPGGDGLTDPFGSGGGSTIGPPLNANFPGGDGLTDPFGSGGGSTIDPPLNANFPGGDGTTGGLVPPPPFLNGPGAGSTGNDRSRQDPPLNTGFPTTELEFDPDTGLPLNPQTGEPFPVDPETGLPFNPDTGLPISYDPETGRVLPIDPVTGEPVLPGEQGTQLEFDPDTGLPIDPETGELFPLDPDTGVPYDPDTGLPINYDPETGQVLPIDPLTGEPISPVEYPDLSGDGGPGAFDPGLPTDYDPGDGPSLPINPVTGQPYDVDDLGLSYPIDPETGEPITSGFTGGRGPGDYEIPPLSTPDPVGLNYGGPTESDGPGGLTDDDRSVNRSSQFQGGQMTGDGSVASPGAGGPTSQGPGGTAAQQGTPPMMPPMMGGMGGAGGQGERERQRSTWLSEDERVWGTASDARQTVLGRPGPGGPKKGAARHDFVESGADGTGVGTSSRDAGEGRSRKRKPGIGNRGGRGKEQARGGQGEREGGTG
ncbi:hypothetical protein ACIBFB_10040 [Nocardiopsis sp. NPDC050513]|uniref:hypothetical protein n=1 Tax=Nocardiopsis sp. NPDC050513 TaxID=3364338 RepID=UPI0037A37849